MSELRGVGDRWIAGEAVDGVAFPPGASVDVVAGEHLGTHGSVLLLVALRPEPRYLVRLDTGADVRLGQSVLAPSGLDTPSSTASSRRR